MGAKFSELKFFETYGSTRMRTYRINQSEKNWEIQEHKLEYQSLTEFFVTAFLPRGYPDSVSDDYLQYQLWDSVQAFASSIIGSLCTHSVLKGVGVGDENATTLAATMTWLLKDGVYMIGRIGFAWLQGTKLDSDCKKWRLFADVMNEAALFLDLISAYFQNYFLLIICMSGLLKALVGVAGSCTRAALTLHQARKNNMADVSAKDGSQETLLNLLAMLCSLFILPVITKSLMLTWIIFFIMTMLHLFANYMAVRSVVMETLNEARFKIYARHYFKEGMAKRNFLSVSQVNKEENLIFIQWPESVQINLGTSIKEVIKTKSFEAVQELLNIYQDCPYLLGVSRVKQNKTVINIAFSATATALTEMEAYYQACYLKHLYEDSDLFKKDNQSEAQLEAASRDYTVKTFCNFKQSLELQKFNTKHVIFNIDSWRAAWGN